MWQKTSVNRQCFKVRLKRDLTRMISVILRRVWNQIGLTGVCVTGHSIVGEVASSDKGWWCLLEWWPWREWMCDRRPSGRLDRVTAFTHYRYEMTPRFWLAQMHCLPLKWRILNEIRLWPVNISRIDLHLKSALDLWNTSWVTELCSATLS